MPMSRNTGDLMTLRPIGKPKARSLPRRRLDLTLTMQHHAKGAEIGELESYFVRSVRRARIFLGATSGSGPFRFRAEARSGSRVPPLFGSFKVDSPLLLCVVHFRFIGCESSD